MVLPPAAAAVAFKPAPVRLLRRLASSGWYFLMPLLSIVLFAGAMAAVLWLLHSREVQQQQDALYRDVAWAQQKLRLNLLSNQDVLSAIARDIASAQLDTNAYRSLALDVLRENPEIVFVSWTDAQRRTRWSVPSNSEFTTRMRETRDQPLEPVLANTIESAMQSQRAAYSRLLSVGQRQHYLMVALPIMRDGESLGTLNALYSVSGIVGHLLPQELTDRYKFSVVDANGTTLAATSLRPVPPTDLWYEVILDPPGHTLSLRAEAYPAPSNLANNMLLWLVIGLSCFVLWSLWSLWRHTRRRIEAQQALVAETSFRRAMEDSMLVGMRALDLEGRIIYVNPAFCRMTGWDESELLGRTSPFPYWPAAERGELQRQLDQTLAGEAPASGFEMTVQHKNNSVFYARMYVSPLIDASGQQTGWMSSMTDISEPKRAREELAAAHLRFTTVLESLDAAVSVLAPDKVELLFANRYYRQLFGHDARGHIDLSGGEFDAMQMSGDAVDAIDGLAGLPASALTPYASDAREIYLPNLQKWFEVRRRYIQWVDGHLAQMIISTDITSRKAAEEIARQHEEKLQFTSRLTTMGEMASSLAHELNQPLAAINNYCMGAVARLRSGSASPQEIGPALEKASAQAVRAGTIIQRIRSFVKRSEPQRRESDVQDIIADAVGLADIEASRRRIRIRVETPPSLPPIFVDPVLIEQVLLNLLKNAVEAMHSADPLRTGGVVRLTVSHEHNDGGDHMAFRVIDQGPGVDEADQARLFEPFFSTKTDGMGMGLNICRSIIESHQGRLWVENNADGVGCTFHILLPAMTTITATTITGDHE